MVSLVNRLLSLPGMVWSVYRPRVLSYRIHRSRQPEGYVHTLSDEELEREIDRWYHSACGGHVDFAHPRSFSEKMQWLKVHDKDPRKAVLSDKLAVREVIAREVGGEVLPKVYRSWDAAADIDFSGIDRPFLLKCNNGSGMMHRVEDPSSADMDEIRAKAAKWLSCDFASRFFEMHYAQITPRVYVEEWIDDIEWEYQAWCFSGKAEFVAAIQNPHGTNKKQFFSPTWERLPFVSSLPEYEGTVDRPDTLPQILECSERLAKDFIFVRVDWYGTRHGLMFSEMSFTPAYGIVKWQPSDYNMKVGELIHLPIED